MANQKSSDVKPNKRGRRKSAPAAVAKNKVTSPAVGFTDFKAASGERMAIARAKLAERLAYMRASLRLTFVKIRHPIHPVIRVAAKEAARETKAAATERRKQAVARARDVAARKRAYARERRARELNRSVM